MVVGRHAPLVVISLALLALAGCAAGRQSTLPKPESPIVQNNATTDSLIAKHNKNAALIRSLSAEPGIEVAAKNDNGREKTGHVDGRLDFERDKNFRLTMKAGLSKKVADIGSNDQGFWFWAEGEDKNKIFVCDHNRVNETPLSVTYQPDWIIEALGLREITPREAATINLSRNPDLPGMVTLTQFRKDKQGEPLTKETVFMEATGRIQEHRLYSGAKKTLLARATILRYQTFPVARTDENSTASIAEVPMHYKLEWVTDKFSLDVNMAETNLNRKYPSEQWAHLFSEPTIGGAQRYDIAQQSSSPASASSRIHETMPQPRSGIRLGQPEALPMDVQGAYGKARTTGGGSGDADPDYRLPSLPGDSASTSSEPSVEVVTAPMPRGGDYSPVQTASNRRGRLTLDQ